ncbi:unnamed protein product [Parnassius apollo]|uniref:(apollo) hypothetical protein n=1 Tax=Parnassius apollo TaxID=110799 RepID=A0A8S3XL34_PARAO|nr:unnamed protein product [Parnassius apollo]
MVIFFVIFLLNGAKSIKLSTKSNIVNAKNTLLTGYTEVVSTLQIHQIRTTSEKAPATSAGNNLNDVSSGALSKPLEVQEENFLTISPIFLFRKYSDDRKYNDEDEGNVKLLGTYNKKSSGENKMALPFYNSSKMRNELNSPQSQNFIWENCMESVFKQQNKINYKHQNEMEIAKNLQTNNNKIVGNFWDKRDADAIHSVAVKSWLEKYNNLKNSSKKERVEKANNMTLLSQSTTTSTVSNSTPFDIFSITKETLEDRDYSINDTLDLAVTENNLRVSSSMEWSVEKDRSKIKFSSLPQMQNYLIPKFKLEEGFHPFTFMSEFFSLIYPFDFPDGIAKDIIWGKNTFPSSFIQFFIAYKPHRNFYVSVKEYSEGGLEEYIRL